MLAWELLLQSDRCTFDVCVGQAVLCSLPVPGCSRTHTHTCAAASLLCTQVSGKEASRCVSRLEALESKLAAHRLWSDPHLLPRLVALQHKEALGAAARAAKKELKAAQVRGGIDTACTSQAVGCLCARTWRRPC